MFFWILGALLLAGLFLFFIPLYAGWSLVRIFSLSRGFSRKESLEYAHKRGHLKPGEDPLTQQKWDDFNFTTGDKLLLKGHWMSGNFDNIMILVHGHKSNSTGILKYAPPLLEAGYGLVVYDTRSFGESQGKVCTGGFKEKEDLLQLIQMVQNRYPEASIGLWGESMGGAAVLQCLEYAPPVDYAVAVCPYTELKQLFMHHLKKRHIKGFLLRCACFWAQIRFEKLCGCRTDAISARKALENNRIPLLLIHGSDDSYVPTRMSIDLHKLYPKQSTLLLVEGGTHADSFIQNPESFWQGAMDFLAEQKKAAPKDGPKKKE